MRTRKTIAALVFMLLLGACVSTNTRFVRPSNPSFVPKEVYELPIGSAWDTTIDVLRENRISIEATDEENHYIATGYISAGTISQIGAYTTADSYYRYKYNIGFTSLSDQRTRVDVIATLEMSGTQTYRQAGYTRKAANWRNISDEAKDVVTGLENWLYEKLENAFSARSK